MFQGFSKAPFFSLRTEPHLPRRRDHVSITLAQPIVPSSLFAPAASAAFFKRCTLSLALAPSLLSLALLHHTHWPRELAIVYLRPSLFFVSVPLVLTNGGALLITEPCYSGRAIRATLHA